MSATADATEDIDLGLLMAPLTRGQLEMVIVRMVHAQPDVADVLIEVRVPAW